MSAESRHRSAVFKVLPWATLWILVAPLTFGLSPPQEALELPEVVVRGIDRVRLGAERQGLLALEPPRIAQADVQVDIPTGLLPEPALQEAPRVQSPGCAYRNPVTGAVARATKGPEALYKTAMERLSRDQLDEAAFFLARLRSDHPDHSHAGDAAFWLAEINRRKGRTDEAIAFLRLVQGTYAEEAAYRLAWLLESEGRAQESYDAWEALAQDRQSSHREEALYRVGSARLAGGDPRGAAEALNQVLALSEEDVDVSQEVQSAALLALGLARRALGESQEAEDTLMRFLLEWPDHPSVPAARAALGWALLDQGRAREATLRFEWVLSNSPSKDLEVRCLYGKLRARTDLLDAAGAAELLSALEAASPAGPWVGWARADLGWLAFREGRYDAGLDWYRSALKVWEGPEEDIPRYMAAECLYLLGRYEEASRAFQSVPSESPLRPAAVHRFGLCTLLAGDPAGAAQIFDALLNQYPGYPESDRVWAWLGEAKLRMNQSDEALLAFGAVPDRSPAYPQALYGRAWIAFESERWDEAADLFSRLLNAYPEDPNRDEALLTLARSHFNRREYRAALEALDRLAASPSPSYRSAARFYRGWMLSRSGRETLGREVLSRLLEEEPTGDYAARAHHTLGWLDYGQGRYQRALAHFEAVIALAPGDDLEQEAREKRADCLYNLGLHAQALEAYRSLGDTPEGRYGAALCLYRMGRIRELAEAADLYAASHPDDPKAADLFFALAQARSQADDPGGAAEAYQRAAELSQGGDRAEEAQLEAARSMRQAGNERGAIATLQLLASRAGPVGLTALIELASMLDERGDAQEAGKVWDQVAARTEGEQRSRALRSAAYWARVYLDWASARKRLREAVETCPPERETLRQALLTDMGELLLLEGRPHDAAETLVQAAEMGTSAEGLRAFILLGRAQESGGLDEEALETYLRIGYLYPLSEPEVAQVLLRAGNILENQGSPERARAVYAKVVAEGPEELAVDAHHRLEAISPPSPE